MFDLRCKLAPAVLALLALSGCAAVAPEKDVVTFEAARPGSSAIEVAGRLLLPPADQGSASRRPAVVLLHSGWGWQEPVTAQYAQALNSAGYVTLEPRLFYEPTQRAKDTQTYQAHVYGALRYLEARPDVDPSRIAVAGFSYGGILSLRAATTWAAEKYGGKGGPRFAVHVPFYPVCWIQEAIAKNEFKHAPMPAGFYAKWTGAPIRILAGGLDDYDDRDSTACEKFVAALPQEAKAAFTVKVYSKATHGWDQPGASFYEALACKGRGCNNKNVPNPEVTREGIEDLISFLQAALRR